MVLGQASPEIVVREAHVMKYLVSELEGALLDAAVAEAVGLRWRFSTDGTEVVDTSTKYTYAPSTRWMEAGPIIERERIAVSPDLQSSAWCADTPLGRVSGPTPLVAAMRAYVSDKMGSEVELP
jgi:hypothetical protein